MAKQQQSTAKPSRRNRLRQQAAAKRKRQNQIAIGVGALILALVALVVFINVRARQPAGDEQKFASQGNLHIPFGSKSPVSYNSSPPSSGPHYENIVGWGTYTEPQRYEHLIHNLEDGGVVIYYQCDDGCPDLYAQLEEFSRGYIDSGDHLVLAPNDPTFVDSEGNPLHEDMGSRIALVAWQSVDKLEELDAERMAAFIDRYEGIDHHAR